MAAHLVLDGVSVTLGDSLVPEPSGSSLVDTGPITAVINKIGA